MMTHPNTSSTVFDRIEHWLHGRGIEFEVLRHVPVYTSAEAAAVRGAPLASGAKALICKADGKFAMFVMPAAKGLAGERSRKASQWTSASLLRPRSSSVRARW